MTDANQDVSRSGRWAKRMMDVLISALMLPIGVLVCIPCLVAIAVESRGSPLLVQRRVGRNRVPFLLFKLRTMLSDTEVRASHEVSANRITRVGRFLRKTKLDELPQIVNVLLGDMSLVGPRPCLPAQTELIEERAARGVFDVRPGITGAAQLAGIDMSTPRALAEADAAYVRTRTLARDFRLLLMTATGGRGDAVSGA